MLTRLRVRAQVPQREQWLRALTQRRVRVRVFPAALRKGEHTLHCVRQESMTERVSYLCPIAFVGTDGPPSAPVVHIALVAKFLRVECLGGGAEPPLEPLRLAMCSLYKPSERQVEGSGLLIAHPDLTVCMRAFAVEQLGAALVTAEAPAANGQPKLLYGVHTHARRFWG